MLFPVTMTFTGWRNISGCKEIQGQFGPVFNYGTERPTRAQTHPGYAA